MLGTIEYLAGVSVARGCGFASLAIVTLMVGLSDQAYLACQAGGTLTLGTCLILMIRGMTARHTPYKRTEVWLMLNVADRPDAAIAQQIIGNVLRDVYFRFALHAACISIVLLAASVVFRLMFRTAMP